MKKATIIKKIKAIIKEYGNFTTADVQATSSPVIKTLGKNSCILAERFGKNGVDGVIYVHETETVSDTVEYEDMTVDTLSEILFLAEDWDTECYKTEKRCS